MIRVKDVIKVIEDFAPLDFQEEYDNSGFTIGNRDDEAKSILITLDITNEVLDEAIQKGANIIISHHPVIFESLKSITYDNLQGEMLIKAIENRINIYSAHTNVDNTDECISREFMYLLDVEDICPIKDSCGIKASLRKPLPFGELKDIIQDVTGDNNLKSIGNYDDIVEEISFFNGACGGSHELLLKAGACSDVFITSEIKYHIAQEAKQLGINVIECGHYESERAFMTLISRKIKESKLDIEVIISERSISPYNN